MCLPLKLGHMFIQLISLMLSESVKEMFDIVYIDVKIEDLYWQRSNIH